MLPWRIQEGRGRLTQSSSSGSSICHRQMKTAAQHKQRVLSEVAPVVHPDPATHQISGSYRQRRCNADADAPAQDGVWLLLRKDAPCAWPDSW